MLAALVPGSAGTLYLHRLFGRTGVHGFRREDGTTLWAFPRVHYAAPVFAFLLAVLAFAAEYESYWLQTVRTPYSLFIGFGALVMLIIVERARRRARREFDSDPGLQPSAA